MKKKNDPLFIALEAAIFILLLWFYASHSLLLPDPSKPYSQNIAYQLQTNAFLQGKVALSPRPFGIPFDYLYTEHGMQQTWGVGVPLLRLPFEWGYRECGFYYFPDRFILLFYIILMMVILNLALRLLLSASGLIAHSAMGCLIRWGFIAWILFSPAMNGLIENDFDVYQEAIFYGCIYSYILLALFWIYIQRPHKQILIIVCLLSGMACLIRPTLIFYGLVTAITAMVFVYQKTRNIQLIMIGFLCFFVGVCLDMAFNYIRFGAMLEFGYSASLSGPTANYMLRFDNPFRYENFFRAAKELISALFFNYSYLAQHYPRLREHQFPVFNVSHLIIWAGGIVFILSYHFFRQPLLSMRVNKTCLRIVYLSTIWGEASFFLFFIFYLYSPGLCSRYLSEFSVALNVILAALVLLGLSFINSCFSGLKRKFLRYVFFLFLITLFYLNNKDFFENRPFVQSIDKKVVKLYVDSFNQRILANPRLPETFYCGHPYWGWPASTDCSVSDSTSIFLPTQKCFTLNYSLVSDASLPKIRVKRGIEFLKLNTSYISENNSQGSHQKSITERFCSEKFLPNTISLYSIGWIKAEKIKFVDEKLPIKLNWVSVSDKVDLPIK